MEEESVEVALEWGTPREFGLCPVEFDEEVESAMESDPHSW